MKIQHYAELKGLRPYAVDEGDLDSLQNLLTAMKTDIGEERLWGEKADNDPLVQEYFSVRMALKEHPETLKAMEAALKGLLTEDFVRRAKEGQLPERQVISYGKKPQQDRVEKHALQ